MTLARPYDVVLYGASGYTGALVADCLAQSCAGAGLRWALAGRHLDKLEAVRSQLHLHSVRDIPDLLHAESGDAGSLHELARRARVLINTVGPYAAHGDALVHACIAQGTHYLDLCDEPQTVDHLRRHWHHLAVRKKVCILPCCGFMSLPVDIGVLHLLEGLRHDFGASLRHQRVEVFAGVEADGAISGGTWAALLQSLAESGLPRLRRFQAAQQQALPARPQYRQDLQRWALPLVTIDGDVVRQSARLRGDYGADFRYGHFALGEHLLPMLGLAAGIVGLTLAAQWSPTRQWLQGRLPSGSGPSAEERARGWFRISLIAQVRNRRWQTQVSGGDPGYGATSHMLTQAALLLAGGGGIAAYGVLTPASALGLAIIPALERGGVHFAPISRCPPSPALS